MSPTQINIAIAEACGWVHRPESDVYYLTPAGSVHPEVWTLEVNGEYTCACAEGLPNYHSDLNAMHEAENMLTLDQRISFTRNLCRLLRVTSSEFAYIHATAAQRAEAFLRTIGKWQDA